MAASSDLGSALILGIIEGLTEYFPVSSTGHLILFGHLFGFEGERESTFTIFIQLGAIAAVVIAMYQRFLGLIPKRGETFEGFKGVRGCLLIITACIPAFVVGALGRNFIKAKLFHPLPVGIAFVVGALLMLALDRPKRPTRVDNVDNLTFRDALIIGLFQCLALWPGMSRSGSTIIGGLLLGVHRKAAAEFSFVVGLPLMCAAVAFDLLKSLPLLSASDIPTFAVGFAAAFIVGGLTVKAFLRLLVNHTLAPFAIYRLFAAGLAAWFFF